MKSNLGGQNWLRDLTSPKTDLRIELNGHPGFFSQRGWRVLPTQVEENLCYFILKGSPDIRIAGKASTLGPGSIAFIKAQEEFSINSPLEQVTQLYRFRWTATKRNRSLSLFPKSRILWGHWDALPLIEQLIHDATYPNKYSEYKQRGLFMSLCASMLSGGVSNESDKRQLTSSELRRVSQFVQDYFPKTPSASEVAAVIPLSGDYFSRAFKRTTGQSLRRWLSEERIRTAALRLRTSGLNITEVAQEFAFSDAFTFSKQFRKVMHVSPSQYLKNL